MARRKVEAEDIRRIFGKKSEESEKHIVEEANKIAKDFKLSSNEFLRRVSDYKKGKVKSEYSSISIKVKEFCRFCEMHQ